LSFSIVLEFNDDGILAVALFTEKKLPKTTEHSAKLPKTTKNYQKPPKATKNVFGI